MKFDKLSKSMEISAKEVEISIEQCNNELNSVKDNNVCSELEGLEERVKRLYSMVGCDNFEKINEASKNCLQNPIDIDNKIYFPDELSSVDLIMSCIAGGLAVLIDFLVVKIPKTTRIVRNGQEIIQEGSPLTELIRSIGFDENGKTSSWVKVLEKYFNVPFDKSIISGEKGFYPKSHRLYSLAHDPSPSGLLWAIKDILCGTTSYIDKVGNLKMVPSNPATIKSKLLIPIIWFGHIISDIFTKAGIPIPGACFLRTLQFGSFGDKRRTLGEIIEYMYLNGYDVRHLATMSTSNAVIEIILRIYHCLTRDFINPLGKPSALIQADKAMVEHRLSKMRFYSYTIAACGNIGKMAVYQWNPTALNLAIWAEFLRTAIKEYEKSFGSESQYIKAIKQRELINSSFENLKRRLDSNYGQNQF